MHLRMRPPLILLLGLALARPASAAAPKIERLFPVGGQRGSNVEARVTGTTDKSTKAWCSRSDVKIGFDHKSRKLKLAIPKTTEPGVCWLRLYNMEGTSPPKAFLIGTLPDVREKEPNDTPSSANRLKSSAVVNGVLSKSGEVDTFAISVKKGQTLVASMRANHTFGSPMDGVLQVVSSRGFVLAQNDDERGFDPRVTYTAAKDGVVYVRAFAFPATPNSSIRLSGAANYIYRLTVTTGPFLDHPMPLAATRGKPTTLRLHGWNIAAAQDSLTVSPGQDGEVRVYREPFANGDTVPVVPFESRLEQEPNGTTQPRGVTLPTVISGHIDKPRDVDVFQFAAKQGQRLRFTAAARGLGSPLDVVLRLTDAKGTVLATAETRSSTAIDESLATTIRTDGTYRLEIRDLHRRGGWRYFYRLTMQPEPLVASLSVAADAFTGKGKKPLTIPVTVVGRARAATDVRLSVAGLPKGVTAKTGQLRRKGKSRIIDVVLTAQTGLTWSGPIRISATAEGRTHAAEAAVAGTGLSTRELWLTVSK